MTSYSPTVENCPMFMTHYRENTPYVFWTPWQPNTTLNKWGAHFPCQSKLFCDDMFQLQESRKIAQAIYDHQHPDDCANAKYLVVTSEWVAGFGSAIHVKAMVLLTAISSGRVLIDAEGNRWCFSNPESCKIANMACFFAPITHCQLPIDWKNRAESLMSLDDAAQFAITNVSHAAAEMARGRGLRGLGHDDKPYAWWVTHTSVFLTRPNMQSLKATCFAWDCIMGGKAQPDRPFASIFVRAGDKHVEAQSHDPHEYFTALWSLSHNLTEPVRSVYVGSDSALHLNRVVQDYRDDWNLSWMGHFRGASGSFSRDERSASFTPRIELQSLITLVDIYLSSAADVLIGTLSSNQCRLMDELRKVQGKARIPYVTPEGVLVAGV